MPVIVSESDPDRTFEWHFNTFVGRRMGPIAGLSLDFATAEDHTASALHAALTWNRRRGSWQIHDLGSVNGTAVNGQLVEPMAPASVAMDDVIQFGMSRWRVVQCAPPPAAAVAQDSVRIARDGLLFLPDEGDPRWLIQRTDHGWYARALDDAQLIDDDISTVPGTRVEHGQTFVTDGITWRLDLIDSGGPDREIGTRRVRRPVHKASIAVVVSSGKDRVEVSLTSEDTRLPLPARRHHELWWLLAEARLEDRGSGYTASEEGWVTTNAIRERLGFQATDAHLSVLVYRSHKELQGLGFSDSGAFIERRTLGGQNMLRLGIADVTVTHE